MSALELKTRPWQKGKITCEVNAVMECGKHGGQKVTTYPNPSSESERKL